uniref:Reverse transcriptase domain-containing protein n=1 Tax=Neogobius melanostomus TaxID=47308 RepID=A0A8C6SLB0_9GOBI
MKSGIVPSELKIAKVVPLYKNGENASFSNYRPISILPCFSKILEKLVYRRLHQHLIKNNILYNYQFGFRKCHSAHMALIELVDRIYTALGKKEFAIGVFLDLSKAFDTVNHNILLQKLHKYGFRDNVYIWLYNYLTNREQYVSIKNYDSKKNSVEYGVPQGSILGPLLFIIYINDFASVSTTTFPVLFADDTNLFISNRDLKALIKNLNHDLQNYSEWFRANKLSLNVKKSNFMLFAGNKKCERDQIKIYINNEEINSVSSTCFLGVQIDDKLCWKEQVEKVCKKITKS